MSFQKLDAKFFRRAKKLNRAVEITDSHAYIPAVRDSPEIRVPLPNRRLKTIEEQQAAIDERFEQIGTLDEEIEVERKVLMDLTKKYNATKTGMADVLVQNLKIQGLMEKRKDLQYPERFIVKIEGVTLKDIFQSKNDMRKVEGGSIFQTKYRIEPITSLYVDLTAEAVSTSRVGGESDDETAPAPATALAATVPVPSVTKPKPNPIEVAKVGAIIGQTKKLLKLKKPTPSGAIGGSGLT